MKLQLHFYIFVRRLMCICQYVHQQYGPRQCNQYSESLQVGRCVYRITVDAKFSGPVQTGLVAHPPSYTMGTHSLSRG